MVVRGQIKVTIKRKHNIEDISSIKTCYSYDIPVVINYLIKRSSKQIL